MWDTPRSFRFCILAALLLILAPFAFSQTITTADAVGVVTDPSGAVVPGAQVTIKSADSGESRTELTNGEGQYRFPLMKPGNYEISAITKGLKSNTLKITLLVGQAQEANIMMVPEGTSTTVEVTATAAILQAENANIETNFNKTQVDSLPMPGGDLTTLAMTAPGIRVNVTGGSSNMNANGIPGASILYTLDGMDQNDPANNINNSGASNNLLGANGVGEVAIVMNAYSPQYGRMAGAQVNMVGLTGSNQFHGNLFYNFNWEKLNANTFFNNSSNTKRGRSDAHQFGGRIGGPVWKNKIFFFFDTENLRYVLPASGVISLPSPQLQAYTLAHVGAAQLPLYQDYFNLVKGSPGIGNAIPVTNGTGQLQDSHKHLGCGINSFYNTPTGTGGVFGVDTPCAIAFGTNNTEINTEQLFNGRGDWDISNSQKLSLRYYHDAGVQATGTSPINPLYNSVSNQPSYQAAITHTWIVNPAVVNTVTGSVLWYTALFGVQDFAKTSSMMPDSIAISDGGAVGGGFATVGNGAFPNGRNVGHFQINDDFSWTRGTHAFKAGVNARYDQYTYTSIASGAFLGGYSLGDLSDFANGKLGATGNALSSFSQSFPLYGALHFRFPSADFYVSDEWAVTKNVKLTYGLRVEEDFNPSCVEKCFVLTNVPFNSPSYQGGANVPYNTTLTKSSNLFYNAEAPLLQPRIGIAYSPEFGHHKTVIRGGIGLFSTNYTDGIGGTLANQVPNKFAPSGLTFGTVGFINDPTSSAYTGQLSANAFQSGFSSGFTLAQIQSAVKPATFSTPSITSFPSTYLAPHTLEWSFEIQQEIDAHNMFTVSYVGNHGYDLAETVNANMYASSTSTKNYGGPYGGLPTVPADSRFVTVTQYYNNGINNHNALTLQFRHTFTYGLTAQFHYTWSHDLGTIGYENPFNLNGSYGSLGFDNRHQAAGDLLWNQPFKADNKVVNALIKGWTVGAKMYIYSGAPFSVSDSKIASDVNSSGVLTPLADLVVPSAFGLHCNKSNAVGQACLPLTDFATYPGSGVASPTQTDWGNIAPNSFRGPGYFDLDGTLLRTFTIREKFKFVFGMQAYNVLNHANFANPSGSLTSNSFGQITSTLGPPTSIYGTSQGASVSGRLAVLTGTFTF
ncbi:Cna B domain protein [Candidatus Sulfopaludibacter sp. SbA3]|nr:Cna B domain protein [Candidatus Sulfopaludibacter sp. SbA3]